MTAPGAPWWRSEGCTGGLVLFALSGVAFAQPLLDLLGKNPEFFVAADAGRAQIVAFALIVTLAVPVLAVLIDIGARAIGPRVSAAVHSALVGFFALLIGGTVARQLGIDATVPFLAMAIAFMMLLVVGERRVRAIRVGLQYLAVVPILLCGLFLFGSATSRLLWEREAEAATGVRVEHPHPVVLVVFDELPLASLITSDGDINAERFPNFARLAAQSTWFRNATSLAPNTPVSLPAIESGLVPDAGALPTSTDYPRNLFTLLGASYQMDVTETITQLCPTSVCPRAGGASNGIGGLRELLAEAALVYGHTSLPLQLRMHLPAVDQSWGGFLRQGSGQGRVRTPGARAPGSSIRFGPFMAARRREMRANLPQGKGALLRAFVGRVGSQRSPALYFLHDSDFPHENWVTIPDGRTYPGAPGPPGTVRSTWGDDAFLVRQGQQRHLLQVGYADTLLGELIDRLEAEGLWDDAVVAVVADHGSAFIAGQPRRDPTDENAQEIYRTPMFIRAPGQPEGAVRDDNALNTDVIPTIVDVLGVETDWDFDGRSLFGDEPPPADKPVVYGRGPSSVDPDSLDALYAVARRNERRFPGRDWRGVFAVGPLGDLVGRPLTALDVSLDPGSSWSTPEADRLASVDAGAGPLPLTLHGVLLQEGAPPPDEGLVVLNGTVAGVAGDFQEQSPGSWDFSAVLDFEQFRQGENRVELLLPTGDGQERSFRRILPG